MIFFSRVLHNENHVLHPLLPDGYELRRRRYERGLFLRSTMPNTISYTDSYINIGLAILTFSPANFLLFNCDSSIYNAR